MYSRNVQNLCCRLVMGAGSTKSVNAFRCQHVSITKDLTVSVNSFRPRKFEDFEIVNEQEKVVGHIRVKPSGVLWAPSNAKVWYGVSLKDFSEYMENNGKKQDK